MSCRDYFVVIIGACIDSFKLPRKNCALPGKFHMRKKIWSNFSLNQVRPCHPTSSERCEKFPTNSSDNDIRLK